MLRLYINQPLSCDSLVIPDDRQAHYLNHVMRLKEGDALLLFNGRDGEWKATLIQQKKQSVTLKVETQTKAQDAQTPLRLLFAPIKRGHGDFTVEKATECGVTRLTPILTQHTAVSRVPVDRYQAIAIEAAEQCERLSIPTIDEAARLPEVISGWNPETTIILCAEQGDAVPIATALEGITPASLALMIGPEGGFSADEFRLLRSQKYIVPVHLGPRILRADTAAITALGIIQALKGDWNGRRD